MDTHRPTIQLGRSAVARYIQLATLFRRRIESGVWASGSQIPTIDELVVECGVARATVRQALGLLEEEGLIARHRAKGTFVLERPREGFWCEVTTDWNGLLISRADATIKVIGDRIVEAPPHVPHPIGELCPSYRHLRRQHWRNNQPFLIADVYIDAALAKKLPKAAFTTQTAMRMAANLPGVEVTDARQTLTVGGADMETAEALEVAINAPIAHVHRSVVDQNKRLVLIASGIYRGDVIKVDVKLK
ncbi:GntR family transcriptional regulator [Peristeroidobacter soli]|jgi:GntR family transcriptional regulator|uniref:GntR family transcriptional regulator n=1 Tax=Peristeroidobacter soli TaxID=2497877 RepID=UPI00158BE829|nr:GntR family transcriptional regulator [Peristeroidobacter soli]